MNTAVRSNATAPMSIWLSCALALLSGVLVGLSQPILIPSLTGDALLDPSGVSGLLVLVALVPSLMALVKAPTIRRAYLVGFVTWFVAFFVILHWLITTIHVYGGQSLVLAIAALSLLTAIGGLYLGAAYAATRYILQRMTLPLWLVFPAAFTSIEFLRNHVPFGGFPWGSMGHSFATIDVLRQSAALFGVSGLTALAAVTNAVLAAGLLAWSNHTRKPWAAMVATAAMLLVLSGYGAWRLSAVTIAPTVKVALLQPNVNEGLADVGREDRGDLLARFHALQTHALEAGAELVVWPEGSFPMRLQRDVTTLETAGVVPPASTTGLRPKATILGAVAVGRERDSEGRTHNVHHNSAFVLDEALTVQGRFDKTHLVPFGEYVPWPLGAIVRQFIPTGLMTPGTSLRPIRVAVGDRTLQVGPTICYEGIFPEITRALANNGATFIANLTDDRWYGKSGMATQHLLMYALRATEVGRPIARATNTGISAWVDTRGRIHAQTRMYTEDVAVADVSLANEQTLYLLLGDWVAWLSLGFSVLLLILRRRSTQD